MIYFAIGRYTIMAFSDPNEDARQYCKMWSADDHIWTDSVMKHTIQSVRDFGGIQLTKEQVTSITGGNLPCN